MTYKLPISLPIFLAAAGEGNARRNEAKRCGGICAIPRVSLERAERQVFALIGPNALAGIARTFQNSTTVHRDDRDR